MQNVQNNGTGLWASLKEVINEFIHKQDTLERKLFWILTSITSFFTLGTVMETILSSTERDFKDYGLWLVAVILIQAVIIGCANNRYNECYMAMVLQFNCLLLPLTYFENGGIVGSTPMLFLAGLLLCAFGLSRRQKVLSLTCSLTFMVTTISATWAHPELVDEISMGRAHLHIIVSLVFLGCLGVAIVNMILKAYHDMRNREINNSIIDVLSTVVESRSVESGDHVMRIKGYTKILLKYVNKVYGIHMDEEEKAVIASASVMHDVGKIGIPDHILFKPGKLTAEEYELMKKHTTMGCDIINSMQDIQDVRYYEYCYEICRYHHERYDGNGYPDGLKGEDIPLTAQIVSLADVYDALVSQRCYKKAFDYNTAYDMITTGKCGAFSDKILECFALARKEMEAFAQKPYVSPFNDIKKRKDAERDKNPKRLYIGLKPNIAVKKSN